MKGCSDCSSTRQLVETLAYKYIFRQQKSIDLLALCTIESKLKCSKLILSPMQQALTNYTLANHRISKLAN